MRVKPLKKELLDYLGKRNLEQKYEKQLRLLEVNWRHRSLKTQLLMPKEFGLYAFRLDRKYRVIFSIDGDVVEVIKITDHYQ